MLLPVGCVPACLRCSGFPHGSALGRNQTPVACPWGLRIHGCRMREAASGQRIRSRRFPAGIPRALLLMTACGFPDGHCPKPPGFVAAQSAIPLQLRRQLFGGDDGRESAVQSRPADSIAEAVLSARKASAMEMIGEPLPDDTAAEFRSEGPLGECVRRLVCFCPTSRISAGKDFARLAFRCVGAIICSP